MKLSRESIVALERHFVGTLSAPPQVWIETTPSPRIALASASPLRAGIDFSALDSGMVETPGEERHAVRVSNPASAPLTVTLRGAPSWLTARWRDKRGKSVELAAGGSAWLDLSAKHDVFETTTFEGRLHLELKDVTGVERMTVLEVRFVARRMHPLGLFDFHGSPVPAPFDFGFVDPTANRTEMSPAYQIRVNHLTSIPLLISFSGLPPWLTVHVDGRERRGPAEGRFFEREAPFVATIRPIASPRFLGRQIGVVYGQTNDPRPQFRSFELHFAASIEPARPFVRVAAPGSIAVRAGRIASGAIALENCGRQPARVSARAADHALEFPSLPVIPPYAEGHAGTATLPIRIDTSRLLPGRHHLGVTIAVDDGEPAEVKTIVPVDVELAAEETAEEKPRVRPELVAALLSFLLLVLSIIVSVGGVFRG